MTPNSPSRAYQGWFLTLYIYSFRLESLQQSFPAWKICLYEDLLSVQDSEMLTCRVQLERNIWEQTYPVISWNQRTEQNASDSCQTVDIREWKPLIPDRNKWGGFFDVHLWPLKSQHRDTVRGPGEENGTTLWHYSNDNIDFTGQNSQRKPTT